MARLARLGGGLLLKIALGEFGELLRLQFKGLPGLAQVGDGRHQLALAFEQALFVPLQVGNVGADRDIAAVLGASLIDLQPPAIGEAGLVDAAAAVGVVNRLAFLNDGLRMRHDLRVVVAGGDAGVAQAMQALEPGIAEDKTVVFVPEHEGGGNGLDRVVQAAIGGGAALGKAFFLGNVDGDPHQMRLAVGGVADHLGAGAQPDEGAVASRMRKA